MIITLTGENSFGLKAELDKLVKAFVVENDDLALERVDGEEASYARIQEALTSLPFLVDKKMVVVSRASANKQFAEHISELPEQIPETTDVILMEPKLDKRSSFYKFVKKSTDFREFAALDAGGLSRWLVAEAKAKGATLSSSDAQYLVDRVGLNQQLLASELEKLSLHNSTINRESIDLMTEATPQSTIFQLLEVAFAGNARRTLQLYQEQRALKVEPPQLIAMLAWQLHILALIKAGKERSADAIAGEAKLSPFVVRKSQNIARKLSVSEVKRLVHDLLDIDARSKREALDIDEAIQNYLLQLAL